MKSINKISLLMFAIVVVCFCFSSSVHAWLYYSKPAFCGRVIDAETRQPIEGAVVVVIYYKYEFGWPGGGSSVPITAKEILTDKKGEFYLPSYRTMINPLTGDSYAEFIIFKPGYKAVDYVGKTISSERYLAIEKDMIGKEGEIKYVEEDTLHTYKGPLGIVELKRAKTYEDRRLGVPDTPTGYTSRELPLIFKAIREDRKERGLEVR